MDAISQFPYLMDMSEVVIPSLPEYWQTADFSDARWESSSLAGHDDNKSMKCQNPGGNIATDYDNWLISPSLQVGALSELHYWIAAQEEYYPAEHYSVLVSTQGTAIENFNDVKEGDIIETYTKEEIARKL